MFFYPVTPPDVMLSRSEGAALVLLGQAGWSRSGWRT
jgi:hypothetical protein